MLSYFLAKRIHYSKGDETQRVSPPAIRIAIAGVAIGVVVMLMAVAIVVGFKEEVRQRVVDFGGHIQLQSFVPNNTYELSPLRVNGALTGLIANRSEVKAVEGVVTKPAVLKTDEEFLSVVMKGSVEFLGESGKSKAESGEENEESGELGEREIAVSRTIADQLRLEVGDDVTAYFVQSDLAADPFALGAENTKVKMRKLNVARIYETHFSEIDQQMVLAAPTMLQGVSGWDEDMYSSLAVRLDDFGQLDDSYYALMDLDLRDAEGTPLLVQTVEQLNPQVFSWLDLLDTNVWVILILIAVVAAFTMISGLLIIILERTQMIGILKAQGLDNGRLRSVFLWVALFLTGRGLLWGNVVGLGLCAAQWQWHFLKLDPKDYYLEWVPIHLPLSLWVLVNVGTIVVTLLVLIGPSFLVARISPAKTLAGES